MTMKKTIGTYAYWAGAAILTLLIFWPILGSYIHRAIPLEVDDSFVYMLRGQQFTECIRQDCPAYNSIRDQFARTPVTPDMVEFLEAEKMVIFIVHTPLHAAISAVLHKLGVDWKTGYWVFTFVGAALTIAAILAWLKATFGPGPAGIGAVLVGTTYFVGHGLIWIVPSNVALMLGLLGCALVMTHGRKAAGWIVLVAVVAVSLHVIGRASALLILLAYVGKEGFPKRRADYALAAGILLAVITYTVLPYLIDRPQLSLPFVTGRGSTMVVETILANLQEGVRITLRSTETTLGLLGFLMVGTLSLLHIDGTRRRTLLFTLAGLVGFSMVSIFHISPRIPGELLARAWLPTAIAFLGCLSYTLWHFLPRYNPLRLLRPWAVLRDEQPNLHHDSAGLTPKGWAIFAAILLSLTVAASLFHVAKGVYAIERARIMISGRHDFSFNSDQPARVVREGCGTVWYGRREALYAYLVYGAAACPARLGYIETEQDYRSQPKPNFAVWRHEMAQGQGWQPLSGANPFTIDADTNPCRPEDASKAVWAYVRAGDDDQLRVAVAGQPERYEAVARGQERWVRLSADGETVKRIVLTSTNGRIEIGGLRRGQPDALLWPWDQGLTVSFNLVVPYQPSGPKTVSFRTHDIYPATCSTVLDDHGMTVLMKPGDIVQGH